MRMVTNGKTLETFAGIQILIFQKDMKNYAGAMESSAKSMELAKADGDDAYIKNNENLQADIKAMPDYVAPKAKKK